MGKRLIIKGASFSINAIDRITPSTTYYSVIYNLSHCTASNNATSVAEGSSYSVTITPQSGYIISNVVVTHNGMTLMPTESGYTYNVNNVSGNIIITAAATIDSQSEYDNNLIRGYWAYHAASGKLVVSPNFGDTDTLALQFVTTTNDGIGEGIPFPESEISIHIPANSKFRVGMSKKSDGSATSGHSSSDIIRVDLQRNSRAVDININNIPYLVNGSVSTYPYWFVNVGKGDNSDVTVADMLGYGVRIGNTNTNLIFRNGFWANHAITSSGTSYPKFVVPVYDNGFIPFSNGEYSIYIPAGSYRFVLSSTLNGSSGTMCRSNLVILSEGTTISSNDIISLVANNTAAAASGVSMDAYDSSVTYLGWSLHYSSAQSSTAETTSAIEAITSGLSITKV